MTVRLLCHHGHLLEISDDLTDQQVVCGRCGSVTATNYTRTSQSHRLAATVESVIPQVEGNPRATPPTVFPSGAPSRATADDSTHDPDDSMLASFAPSRARSGSSLDGSASI